MGMASKARPGVLRTLTNQAEQIEHLNAAVDLTIRVVSDQVTRLDRELGELVEKLNANDRRHEERLAALACPRWRRRGVGRWLALRVIPATVRAEELELETRLEQRRLTYHPAPRAGDSDRFEFGGGHGR